MKDKRIENKEDITAAIKNLGGSHMITVGAGGTQVRVWNGLPNYFSEDFGGHFDSSESKRYEAFGELAQEFVYALFKKRGGRYWEFVDCVDNKIYLLM